MRKLLIAVLSVAVFSFSQTARAAVFGMDKAEVEETIRSYLLEHPELIREVIEKYAERERLRLQKEQKDALDANRVALEYDPNAPVIGNPDGNVTIVEFYDYNCGYCKVMFPKILQVVKTDGNIRWVLKDFPSLRPSSVIASLAGLAANKQGKFLEMHKALMQHRGEPSEKDITDFAKRIGLDMNRFRSDMKSADFETVLRNNRILAKKIGLNGIPDIIVGDTLFAGAVSDEDLIDAVNAAREKKD